MWTILRLLIGVMWVYNIAWKVPPKFGGLHGYTNDAVSHPVFAPYTWVVQHLVLPNFAAFGYGVLLIETLLAVAMLSGSYIRLAAILGALQSLAIGLSVARAPGEWPWSYLLMVLVHLALLIGLSGRYLAVDAIRADQSNGAGLARFWGVGSVLLGVWAVVGGLGASPVAAKGTNLQLTGLEFGLGVYNLLGGLFLVVTGLLLLAWSLARRRGLAGLAALVAAVAAVSLRVQIGFGAPLLGGDGTSAAFLFVLVVVAAVLAGQRGANENKPRPAEHRREPAVVSD